jgi:hypothetical protein
MITNKQTTPMGAFLRDSGLTPAPVALDARQQRFTARLASACEGSKLKEVHDHPMSGAPICKLSEKSTSEAGKDHALAQP